MNIKGKEYMLVNDRVKLFRQAYPIGDIKTEIVSLENGIVVIRADIFDQEGKHLATGTAYEKENSTFINKTSYIENCETSAVGRALGFLGIGIDTSIASAEEVLNAEVQQDSIKSEEEGEKVINQTKLNTLKGLFKQIKNNPKEIYDGLLAKYEIKDLAELKNMYFTEMMTDIKSYLEEES